MSDKQVQKSGDDSVNIQAKSINIQTGLTYSDVKEIALDVFKSNFAQLSEVAAYTAKNRAEEITEKFLCKLANSNPNALNQAQEPDFQYSLLTVQKEYAKTGDKDLGDLLVDILVERTKTPKRSIRQIVLSESLKIAPKLTQDNLAALSVGFIILRTFRFNILSLKSLEDYFKQTIEPLVPFLTKESTSYLHLNYTGCVLISTMSFRLIGDIFLNKYPGIFYKGFSEEVITKLGLKIEEISPYITKCLHNEELLQLDPYLANGLKLFKEKEKIPENLLYKITKMTNTSFFKEIEHIQKKYIMNHLEVQDYLKKTYPYFETLIDIWNNSLLGRMDLTTVGMAIGHANIKRVVGNFSDLGIWIK